MAPTDPEDVLTMIPDPAFRVHIKSRFVSYDSNGNGKLSLEEAAEWDVMWIRNNSGIVSLAGIEHFTGLTELVVQECSKLTLLDVSGLTSLTYLICQGTKLTTLDVSGLTELTQLTCGNNQLTSLDLSGCSALKLLNCVDNRLASLDISDSTGLTSLYIFMNPGRDGLFLIRAWFTWNPANGDGSLPAQLSETVSGLNVKWPYYSSGTVSARFVNARR